MRYDGAHERTYVGWVAQDGDIKVSAYDHATLSRTTVVLASKLQVDDHANPALQVLPDGRLRVFYAAHYGNVMSYRTSRNPEDITSWDAPLTVPVNWPGTKGYTYPNPTRLSAERTSYLFWRGGNHNPTFSTQADGANTWSPARTLVSVPGQRPYIKYDGNGTDTIRFAFTNPHPAAVSDVNIYYAAYRSGGIFRADGTRIASVGTAITPSQADRVYDTSRKAWVHDVAADSTGRPVVVFASFVSTSDHRYMYARWTGSRWQTSEITAAGGSISLDGKEPYYSAGITLDHEDPSTVYLSRLVAGIYEVETWSTADGGTTWTRQAVTSADTANNVRPISPRGLIPFTGDLSVVWIRGIYDSYVDYKTSISTIVATGGNSPPIADAELAPRTGTAPQAVSFDGRPSRDPDGSVAGWNWDFGDGTQGTGPQATHTYTAPGRFFPKLTVTDNAGATDTFVTEVVIQPAAPPTATTGAAGAVTASGATLSATVNPHNQATTYRFDYGQTTAYGSTTADQPVTPTDDSTHAVTAAVSGLTGGRTYHYRVVATNATGTTTGADGTFTTAPRRRAPTATRCSPPPGSSRTGGSANASGPSRSTRRARTPAPTAAASHSETPARSRATPTPRPGSTRHGRDDCGDRHAGRGGHARGVVRLARRGRRDARPHLRRRVDPRLRQRRRPVVPRRRHDVQHRSHGGVGPRRVAPRRRHEERLRRELPPRRRARSQRDGRRRRRAGDAVHIMRNGTFAQYVQGAADEVAIYAEALPPSAIAQHWSAGHGA